MLTILGDKVPKHISSGALDLQREISSGKQEFDTDSKNWPVNQPTIKVEARSQCSGSFSIKNNLCLKFKVTKLLFQVRQSMLTIFR